MNIHKAAASDRKSRDSLVLRQYLMWTWRVLRQRVLSVIGGVHTSLEQEQEQERTFSTQSRARPRWRSEP